MKLEELQDRLSGTHDFNDLTDCQDVIEMLLRDLEGANTRAEQTKTDLKALAFMVTRGNPKAQDRAEQVLSGLKRSPGEVMSSLMRMSEEMDNAEGMNAETLTKEVFRGVWGNLEFDSRPSAVLEEMLRRFKKLTGQKDSHEDNTDSGNI